MNSGGEPTTSYFSVLQRSTLIVEGPLAIRMRRAAAARAKVIGREIATLPQLASRLASEFQRLAGPEELYPAICTALAQGGFAELNAVRDLPGTPRAVARSLQSIGRADLKLAQLSARSLRVADLHLIEQRVVEALPTGQLLPQALSNAAVARLEHAPALLGAVTIQGLIDIDPVWRPLVAALADMLATDHGFPGAWLVPFRRPPTRSKQMCPPIRVPKRPRRCVGSASFSAEAPSRRPTSR